MEYPGDDEPLGHKCGGKVAFVAVTVGCLR